MASLSIRNIPDEVHSALRIRAAKSEHSMEAEARSNLPEQQDFSRLQALINELYQQQKPANVVDDLITERQAEAKNE